MARMPAQSWPSSACPPIEFALTESKWGLHLIQVRGKDQNGAQVAVSTLLDEYVAVPFDERPPFGHVEALARSLTQKAGLRVDASTAVQGFGFDNLFRDADLPPRTAWGTVGSVKARDALVALLGMSATTFTWHLNCQPATPGFNDTFCVLNVSPIRVEVRTNGGKLGRKVLEFDRCVRCKRLAPPAAVP